MKSVASLSAAVALLSGTTNAFWRMPCFSRTTLARLDPIVDFGTASSHGHTVHGGSNFGETTKYADLRASDCTSCQFDDDKSAYWTPSLHFVHDTGMVEIVPQIGGMLAYYLLLGDNLKAFPEGFEMLAGDSRNRNFSGPVPDPPTSAWGLEDMTQEALAQKSLGFNCLNYNRAPEGSRYRHFLPDKAFMDENCADGIRAEIFFPSCWNGKDVTAPDHKSHMAYPNLIDGGKCPEGFETRLPSLFYETIWNTNAFKGKAGQFVWSNGDPTGYGYHADFINGWNIDVLQSAVTDCTNPSGRTEYCVHFNGHLQTEAQQDKCDIQELPSILKADDCAGPAKGLCGNVPVQYGPGYANPLKPGSGSKPTAAPIISSVPAVPTQSYAPARSEGPGGISKFEVNTAESKPEASPVAPKVEAPPAPPVVTPAPAPAKQDANGNAKILSTSTFTSAGVVYEMVIEEVVVEVTVTEDGSYKHRRHADAHHMRRHIGARH